MFGLFKKQDPIDPIEAFWTWFQENEKDWKNFQSNPDRVLKAIMAKGSKIEKGLAFELEPPKKDTVNMTISADGIKDIFPLVLDIVARAPKLEGWNFIAFRQRMSQEQIKGMILKSGPLELNPNKMKFAEVISGDTLDLIIYAEGVTEQNYNQVSYGGLLLMDNLLGEYDCVTKVRSYDFQKMPGNRQELASLKPLLEVAPFVDKFYKNRK
jgi:hypothetical protein